MNNLLRTALSTSLESIYYIDFLNLANDNNIDLLDYISSHYDTVEDEHQHQDEEDQQNYGSVNEELINSETANRDYLTELCVFEFESIRFACFEKLILLRLEKLNSICKKNNTKLENAIDDLYEKNSVDGDGNKCVGCLIRPPVIVATGCGHVVYCKRCIERVNTSNHFNVSRKCPKCRCEGNFIEIKY